MGRLLTFVAACLLSASAAAMPITGQAGWGGEYTQTGDVLTFSNVEFDFGTGDLGDAGIADGVSFTMAALDIGAGFTPGVSWISNGFTLVINSLHMVTEIGPFVIVEAGAIISGNGFDATPARLFLSGNGQTFSAQVPEPQSALLALTGMLALIGLRRRKMTQRA